MKDSKANRPEIPEKLIDLEKVIASKNPRLLKQIPGFVLSALKKIIHVDDINRFVWKHRDAFEFDMIQAIVDDFGVKLKINGLENIPEKGAYMVVANHPLGGLDGVSLIHAVSQKRKDILFPVNDLLMNLVQVRKLMVPINKHGRNTQNLSSLENAFASENILLFFPAGLVSRLQKGEIKDLEWKHTFINKARKYQRDVIPTHIRARNRMFFYRLAQWRKRLGIKANIEMLFLPKEVFKFNGGVVEITFGKPIPYTHFDKSKSPKEWAAWTKEEVYKI